MTNMDWTKWRTDLDAGLELLGLAIQNSFRRANHLPELTLEEHREIRHQLLLSALNDSIEEIPEETDVMADYVEHLRESNKSTNKVPNVGVTAEQFTDGLKHLSDLGHSIGWQSE